MRRVVLSLLVSWLCFAQGTVHDLERGDPVRSFVRFLQGKADTIDMFLIKSFGDMVEMEVPDYIRAYAEGLVKEKRGDLKGALESYLRSIRLNPGYNPSYFRFNDLIRRVENPEVYREKITAILMERFRKAPPVIVENPDGKYLFLVEKMSQYLFVFKGKKLVGLYPVTTGEDWEDKWREGDRRTPEGIYYFTRFIPPERLPRMYGGVAVVLNYPNPVDRLLKKGGGGIWLHGSEEGDRNRIPFSTRGCVVASNEDLKDITEKIKLGNTLIAVYKAIPEKIALDDVREFIEEWKRSWEQKDIKKFFSFYSKRFTWKGGGLREWKRYKKKVILPRKFIRVSIDDLTILAFRRGLSEEVEYYVAEFFQRYRSDVYSDEGIKRLYIIKENGKLRILKEEFSEGG